MKQRLALASLTVVAASGLLAGTAQAHRATCRETTNPAGNNVPPAGFTTAPGTNPNSGQNPDGFYILGTDTGQDRVFIFDSGSGTVFGPFAPGTKIKYTESNGAKPGIKSIGGPNSAVAWHINGKGDAFAFSGDGVKVPCLVPPPPK